MSNLRTLDVIGLVLVIVGGLNWGLVGAFQFDLVESTIGALSMVLARIIYVLVGLAAVYAIVRFPALAHVGREGETHVPHPA